MTTTANQHGTSIEHRIGPRGRFLLRQSSGEISIRGVEGDAARVRSLDDRALGDLFTVELRDDALELRQIEKLGFGIFGRREGAELEIEVPHGASVSIETASADVQGTDLSGEKRFRSASGDVDLARMAGKVDVETVSGEVKLAGSAPIDLIGRTVSGDMQVRVPSLRGLEMGTTSGDIELDAQLTGDGPFAIRSISGDVRIVGRSSFRVEAESVTGDLSSDVPGKRDSMPGRKVLVIGRQGPTLTFRSVSGDFHVKQPRDLAPESAPDAPAAPEPPAPPSKPAGSKATEAETARLDILRQLERGDIDVAEATARLTSLDEVPR
jgi:putative adhesin